MAVFRVEKTKDYTVMANYHLDDKGLSLKARGLLSTMLRLPDDWDYTIAGLTRLCKDGKAAIASALKELEEAGYITRRQLHGTDGTFGENEYTIHEFPVKDETPEPEPPEDEGGDGVPLTDFQSADAPLTDFPLTENPSTENQPQPNTNKPSPKFKYPPIIPPPAKRKRQRKAARDAPDWKPERFAGFWEYYPRGEGKQKAMDAWDKLQPDDELINKIAAALRRQKASEDWQRGFGIPHASTYLNQRRWEDELRDPVPGAPPSTRVVETQKVVIV